MRTLRRKGNMEFEMQNWAGTTRRNRRGKQSRGSALRTAMQVNQRFHPTQPTFDNINSLGDFDNLNLNNHSLDIEATMADVFVIDANARPPYFKTNFQEACFVFTVMMATAATTFLQGVIVINTVAIGNTLNMTESEVTWISAAIGLGSGSFMLFFGKTADLFGRKRQLIAGLFILGFISILAAFCPKAIWLDIICGFLGLGTAIISPPAIGTLFATYPEGKRRNKAAGALGAGNPVGFILGSISSGIAAKIWDWRASFFVMGIFFFSMTVLAIWAMPSIPRTGDYTGLAKRFDYLGTVLTVVGTACITAGLTQGADLGWKSPHVMATLIAGALLILGFIFWENIHASPLLDLSIWKNRHFTLCVLGTLFGYMSFVTNQFWVPLYMQEVQHLSPLHIAVRMLPQAIAGIFWSYLGQYLMSRISGKTIMLIGGFCYAGGALLLVFIRPETSYWKFLFPAMVFTVVGADFQFIVANLYVTKQMPTQSSLAAGIIQTAYRLSVSFGLAITSAVYMSFRQTPKGMADSTFPYTRVYLCGVGFAAAGLLFIPFMDLDMQGGHKSLPSTPAESQRSSDPEAQYDQPRPAGEFREYVSGENSQILSSKPSQSSIGTNATCGSEATYFQRWSWEDDPYWPLKGRGSGYSMIPGVLYEVCLKCLQERRVIVPIRRSDDDGVYDPGPYEDSKHVTQGGSGFI